MEKLIEVINAGEGHTIFKSEYVVKALTEAGYTVSFVEKTKKHEAYFTFQKGEQKASCSLTPKPTKPAKSKYDVVSWNGEADYGVYDLDFISALVRFTEAEKKTTYNGPDCMGRGFQYRGYREWYLKENGITVKE